MSVLAEPIRPRSDEPHYGQHVCLGCNRPLPFETKAHRCPVSKKKHDAKRAAERKQ